MPEESSMQELFSRSRIYDSYRYRRRYILLVPVAFSIIVLTLYCLFVFGPPIQGILIRHEQILKAQVDGMQKIPDLEARLTKLESQINLLTTESVDARLKNIEQSIHVGRVRPGDVASLNDMKNEVQQIKTYMFRDPRELVELKELQTNYRKLSESINQMATKETLDREIASTNSTSNILFVLVGIIFTILFGSLFFGRRSSKKEVVPTAPIAKPDAPVPPTNNING